MQKIRKYTRISLLLGLLLLTGCSTFGFLFERLDWLALWKMDQMFDLTRSQEKQLKPELKKVQEWLRSDGFPIVIDALTDISKTWQSGNLIDAHLKTEEKIEQLSKVFLDASSPVINTLSTSFMERNALQYREYCQDQQDEWFFAAKSKENKVDKTVERLEVWFGHLTDRQVALVDQLSDVQPNEYQIRLDNNYHWRESFINAALNRDGETLNRWLNDPSIFWTEEYRELYQTYKQQRLALVTEFFPTLTEKQKEAANEELVDWVDKFESVL